MQKYWGSGIMANTRWTDQLLIGKIGQIRLIYCTTITRLQIDAFMVKSKKLELWFNCSCFGPTITFHKMMICGQILNFCDWLKSWQPSWKLSRPKWKKFLPSFVTVVVWSNSFEARLGCCYQYCGSCMLVSASKCWQ